MKAVVLKGSKQEIAADLARVRGDVREAIVFVEDIPRPEAGTQPSDGDDIFAEMRPFMVDVPDLDDSRAAIYSPTDGE